MLALAAVLPVTGAMMVSSGKSILEYEDPSGRRGFGAAFSRAVEDAKALASFRDNEGGYLEVYYKVSFWTSMVVGGSFAFSPLSPLAIVNEDIISSQLLQRAFGLGTVFCLAPVQCVLAQAARSGAMVQ